MQCHSRPSQKNLGCEEPPMADQGPVQGGLGRPTRDVGFPGRSGAPTWGIQDPLSGFEPLLQAPSARPKRVAWSVDQPKPSPRPSPFTPDPWKPGLSGPGRFRAPIQPQTQNTAGPIGCQSTESLGSQQPRAAESWWRSWSSLALRRKQPAREPNRSTNQLPSDRAGDGSSRFLGLQGAEFS